MTWNIISVLIAIAWVVINIATAKAYSAKEMRRDFVEGQCLVGKIFANIFYAPAWILKGLRFIVLITIK